MMLRHVEASISDIYALPDPAKFGLALAADEEIIDEIFALATGAYYRVATTSGPPLKLVTGIRNGSNLPWSG
ncbi:hypothetical protein [Sphingomonas sp. TZW2008]|uniref:hypothetical protein n=1 Tax=Sphingomonas sp. TZW2008 TaxID=1917973 RepID=UPI000A269152|nr:hypothetical protein [Sphingomonas sp. TZW2008]